MNAGLRTGLGMLMLAAIASGGRGDAFAEPQAKVTAPLLLVPGILGSFPQNPDDIDEWIDIPDKTQWLLAEDAYGNRSVLHRMAADVFMHLRARIMAKGYVRDRTLFAAPYDWRRSITDYRTLRAWITYAIATFNLTRSDDERVTQVDIIAHSLGGLVVRSYLQSKQYAGDIRSLAIVASPHFGASDSYYLWSGGEVPPGYSPRFAEFLHGHLAAMNAKIDRQPGRPPVLFIRKYILSVRDLLPTPVDNPARDGFLLRGPQRSVIPFTNMHTKNRNLTLEQLNAKLKSAVLPARVGLFVANGRKTLSRIEVGSPRPSGSWEDGQPTGNVLWGDGDNRVLFAPNIVETVGKVIAAAPADHQSAVCIFTPDIFQFLGIPATSDDRCSVDVRPPTPILAFTLTTNSKADLSVIGPGGEKLPGGPGDRPVWRTARFMHFQVDAPTEGSYEMSVSGSAGEHDVFVRYASGPLSVSAAQRAFTFGKEMQNVWRISLRGNRLDAERGER